MKPDLHGECPGIHDAIPRLPWLSESGPSPAGTVGSCRRWGNPRIEALLTYIACFTCNILLRLKHDSRRVLLWSLSLFHVKHMELDAPIGTCRAQLKLRTPLFEIELSYLTGSASFHRLPRATAGVLSSSGLAATASLKPHRITLRRAERDSQGPAAEGLHADC